MTDFELLDSVGGLFTDPDLNSQSADLFSDINNMEGQDGHNTATLGQADILEWSMEQAELTPKVQKSWENETDALLDSILTGSSVSDMFGPQTNGHSDALSDKPFSDTSSDSGCLELNPTTLSPRSDEISTEYTVQQPNNLNLIEYITQEVEEDERELKAVSPVTNSPPEKAKVKKQANVAPEPLKTIRIVNPTQFVNSSSIQTGTTTIVLPVMNIRHAKQVTKVAQSPQPPSKRRRLSASSSDSGLEESNVSTTIISSSQASTGNATNSKYPALILNEEEKRLCEREGVKLPSHYPLSREEEKNLKRIRRKIRNKVSAQDSRKRKKEYVDAMEDRVKKCTAQNDELNKKIQLLETQNKTLAGQLKRLHQIICNGGLKNSQTSTAMMILLLSTAIFLIPGLKENSNQESKCDLDITQAIKMPPMPGQSRSLLQFTPIKQEDNTVDTKNNVETIMTNMVLNSNNPMVSDKMSTSNDHDYYITTDKKIFPDVAKASAKPGNSYIEADAEPQGYGPGKVKNEIGDSKLVERRVNVTNGRNTGMRTVVLHVPKDIK